MCCDDVATASLPLAAQVNIKAYTGSSLSTWEYQDQIYG